MPDLFCCHKEHGIRLVEVKLPGMVGSTFTVDQIRWFPRLSANGAPIWILTNDTPEEYRKLFEPENWLSYMVNKL